MNKTIYKIELDDEQLVVLLTVLGDYEGKHHDAVNEIIAIIDSGITKQFK